MVNAGSHKLRLVRGDEKCEREMKLEGGKSAVFDCVMTKSTTAGSAASTGSGSAAVTTGSGSGSAKTEVKAGSGSGSATQVATADPKTTDPKTTETKTTDPKTTDPKTTTTTDPKTTDPKTTTTKTTDPKTTDPKTTTTTKTTDPKTTTTTTKTTDKLPPEDKKTPPAATDKGFLEIYSTKKAKILVDGVDTGLSTPITGKTLSLTPGKHKITFVVGEDRFTFPTTIKAGATEVMRKEISN
jgi:hypothetical protein